MVKKRVLLCGGTGFLGKNIVPVLTDYEVFAVGTKNYDLLHLDDCDRMFQDIKPEIVVHLAAKSGGILANKKYAADFWYHNMLICGNVWEFSKLHKVKKLLVVMPGCAYPSDAPVPVKEESMWDGFPDLHPAPGALAKKMSVAASYAYRQQYGLNSQIIIPANAYGEFDLFDEFNSHVIPALILKVHKAKRDGLKEITFWGSGKAIRDFIYAQDVANCIPYFIENDIKFSSTNPCLENICNISTGVGTSIKELAETIVEVLGYEGKVNWDLTKPDGPANKTFSNERMKSLGLKCETSLRDGIQRTYEWFLKSAWLEVTDFLEKT
jgi:GDP-L-fucose synthase